MTMLWLVPASLCVFLGVMFCITAADAFTKRDKPEYRWAVGLSVALHCCAIFCVALGVR